MEINEEVLIQLVAMAIAAGDGEPAYDGRERDPDDNSWWEQYRRHAVAAIKAMRSVPPPFVDFVIPDEVMTSWEKR